MCATRRRAEATPSERESRPPVRPTVDSNITVVAYRLTPDVAEVAQTLSRGIDRDRSRSDLEFSTSRRHLPRLLRSRGRRRSERGEPQYGEERVCGRS
jgi:hypothetical protein